LTELLRRRLHALLERGRIQVDPGNHIAYIYIFYN
jgi:hypothetical protein